MSAPKENLSAVCILKHGPTDTDKGVNGVVRFTQGKADGSLIKININITGLAPGQHGFHIHALGDITKGCMSAGGHFNPDGSVHGGPTDAAEARHAGDLGNVEANADGIVDCVLEDSIITLKPGKYNILSRSVIVHEGIDDLGKGDFPDSKTTGHAGARVACGVIGLAEDV